MLLDENQLEKQAIVNAEYMTYFNSNIQKSNQFQETKRRKQLPEEEEPFSPEGGSKFGGGGGPGLLAWQRVDQALGLHGKGGN